MNVHADPKRHISEGLLTTAEINRFGTLETAESVNGVGLSDICWGMEPVTPSFATMRSSVRSRLAPPISQSI